MEWLVFPPGGGLSVTKGRSKLSWWQHPKWKEGLSLLERSGCCATGEKHHEHLFNRNFSFVWREGHWRNCWKTPWRTCSFHFQPFIEGIASRTIFQYFCNVSNQPWTFEGRWDPKKSVACQDSFEGSGRISVSIKWILFAKNWTYELFKIWRFGRCFFCKQRK